MKTAARVLVVVPVLLLATLALSASGEVGVFAIVSKVVLEPSDTAPERIQIWGAFTLVDRDVTTGKQTLTPQRGYMYFTLSGSPSRRETALKEWADFKAIAGTGQAVAFGRFGYIGRFSDELISRPSGSPPYVLMGGDPYSFSGSRAENPVRAESAPPGTPSIYPLNMGLTKLSSTGDRAAVVKQLQDALTRQASSAK
jgi:hypothetical protein